VKQALSSESLKTGESSQLAMTASEHCPAMRQTVFTGNSLSLYASSAVKMRNFFTLLCGNP